MVSFKKAGLLSWLLVLLVCSSGFAYKYQVDNQTCSAIKVEIEQIGSKTISKTIPAKTNGTKIKGTLANLCKKVTITFLDMDQMKITFSSGAIRDVGNHYIMLNGRVGQNNVYYVDAYVDVFNDQWKTNFHIFQGASIAKVSSAPPSQTGPQLITKEELDKD